MIKTLLTLLLFVPTLLFGASVPFSGLQPDQFGSNVGTGKVWIKSGASLTNLSINGQTNIGVVIAPTIDGSTAANGDITINGTTSGTKTTSYVIIQEAGGYLGVGTPTPGAQIDMVGGGQGLISGNYDDSGLKGASLILRSTIDAGYQGGAVIFGAGLGQGLLFAGIKGNLDNGAGNGVGRLDFLTRTATSDTVLTPKMSITKDGNVGIGTISPVTGLDNAQTFTSGNGVIRTNLTVTNLTTSLQGFASFRDNKVAPATITFPASDGTWTNTLNCNIEVYINNIGVTGTSIKKNGGEILSGLISGYTMILQPGEYFSETYTIGTPTGKYSPF